MGWLKNMSVSGHWGGVLVTWYVIKILLWRCHQDGIRWWWELFEDKELVKWNMWGEPSVTCEKEREKGRLGRKRLRMQQTLKKTKADLGVVLSKNYLFEEPCIKW